MTTPYGEGIPGWPTSGTGPSPEFIAALQAEIVRRQNEAAKSAQDMFTPLDATCVTAHTLFTSALRAGFTERNAIIFAVEILTKQ